MAQEDEFARRRAVLQRQLATQLPDGDTDSLELLMWTVRLGRLMEAVTSQLRGEAVPLDMSAQAVLTTLLLGGPPYEQSPTALSRIVVQTSGGMAKTLKRLQEEGLITRARSVDDGRVMTVLLTSKGRAVAERALAHMAQAWSAIVGDLDRRTAAHTVTALAPVLAALEAAAGLGSAERPVAGGG